MIEDTAIFGYIHFVMLEINWKISLRTDFCLSEIHNLVCFVIFWGQFLKFKVQLMYFYLIRFVDQWQIYKRVDWGKNGILILWKQRGNYWQKCLKTITIIAHKIFIFYVLSFHFTHFFSRFYFVLYIDLLKLKLYCYKRLNWHFFCECFV